MSLTRNQQSMRVFGDLVRFVHEVSQDGARRLREHGFTPAQYQVLVAVGTSPGCAQQALSDRLGVTKGNVSMLVSRLEDAGLIARISQGAAYGLRLTGQGAETVAGIRPDHVRFMAARFAALDDAELAELDRLLGKLAMSRVAPAACDGT